MRYIKIRGASYGEAMKQLKKEYGDDAIPLSHRTVREGGLFNGRLFGKDIVELKAGIQDRKTTGKKLFTSKKVDYTLDDPIDVKSKEPVDKVSDSDGSNIETLSKTIDILNDNLNGLKTGKVDNPVNSVSKKSSSQDDFGDILRKRSMDIQDEKSSNVGSIEKELLEMKSNIDKLLVNKEETTQNFDDDTFFDSYNEILKSNDYDDVQRLAMLNKVKNSMSRDDLKDKSIIEKNLKDLIKSKIVTTGPIKTGNKKKVVMFIGPTGVGKTTTMAKLGALHSLREGRKVVFITLDNYRIAATEQLKKYAEIIKIPVYAVNNKKDFKDIVDKEKAEIIMVDTSGRSHRNDLKISEINGFAEVVEYDFEKILCVSANVKKQDIKDIFKSFNAIKFDSVIITKTDETSFIGNVVDIADKYNKPISYFTNGQEVPNDIEVAEPDKIVNMIIRED